MDDFRGDNLSWQLREGVVELALHREPANEMNMAMLVVRGPGFFSPH